MKLATWIITSWAVTVVCLAAIASFAFIVATASDNEVKKECIKAKSALASSPAAAVAGIAQHDPLLRECR